LNGSQDKEKPHSMAHCGLIVANSPLSSQLLFGRIACVNA
jgi:hypothetical protein